MAGKRIVWGLSVLLCLLFGTCSLGTDIETLRGRVQKDKSYTISFESNGVQVYSADGTTPYTGTVDLSYVQMYDNSRSSIKQLNELIDGNPTAKITDGKLTFTLGTPKASSLQYFDTSNMPPGITVSATGVKIFSISNFSNSTGSTRVDQQRLTNDQTYGGVLYVYSNKDVNISGTYTDTGGDNGNYTYTYAMNLKTGWNSVIQTDNQTGGTTRQMTVKTGTPSADYKWVIQQ